MADARGFTHLLCGQIHVRSQDVDDAAIAGLASRQHGLVARRQLLELGISERAVDHRLALGRLRLRHPGVYAVGHEALTFAGRAMAATMSVASPLGRRTRVAASHWTTAALWELAELRDGPIHVTATQSRSPRPAVAIHRAVLPPEDVTIIDGIPVTSVERLLLDLAATARETTLRRLVKQAQFKGLTDGPALVAILERYPRRRGRAALERIVRAYVIGSGRTRSELEDRFLAFCAGRGLRPPETNVTLQVRGRRFEVDCLWRRKRLIVELDGYRAHGTEEAFQDDRARDRALVAAGWSPMRVTWAQLRDRPDTLESEIRDALVTGRYHQRGFAHPGRG